MSKLIVAIVISLAAAGCHCKTDPPGKPICGRALEPCHGIQCGTGGNSPYTNLFPVNGLSSAGSCNTEQIQLIPGSLHGPNCPAGSNLGFDPQKSRLVGKRGNEIVCEVDKLKDASFKIGTHDKQVELTITDVRQISEGKGAGEGKAEDGREGYRIVEAGKTASACNAQAAFDILQDLGFKEPSKAVGDPPVPDGYAPGPDDDFVIAMGGPIFDVNNASLVSSGGDFFNLACVDDALAKTEFYKLNTTPQRTVAALRMITAKYSTRKSYTVRGMTIGFEQFPESSVSKLEALWDHNGKVLCLEAPRLLGLTVKGELYPPTRLPAGLQPDGCAATGNSATPGTCEATDWLEKLQKESGVYKKPCDTVPENEVGLASYVDGAGKLILTLKNKRPPHVTKSSLPPANAPTSPDPAATK